MKKLMGCALAVMAIATTAKAELSNIWINDTFSIARHHDATPPNSSTQLLATLTSDRDNTVNKLSVVESAGGQVVGLLGDDGQTQQMFTLAQIGGSTGAVLISVSGRNAVILKGTVDASQQGQFTVKYLTNGLFMSYKSCNFNLKHDSKGYWIQNAYTGAAVSTVNVTTSSLGINQLEGLCP